MDRQLLEQPFSSALIRTRKGTFGKPFRYVEGAEYVKRLNVVFEGDWSFEVVQHQTLDTEVVVLGKLTCEGVTKMAFGGSSITVSREGEVISIADDLKAAATDALKKASSLLGIGLHLHSDTEHGEGTPGGKRGRSTPSGRRRAPTKTTHRAAGNGNGHDRLTQKQLSAIWSMARSLNQSVDAVRQHCAGAFGVQPEHLTRGDASALIGQMAESLGGGR